MKIDLELIDVGGLKGVYKVELVGGKINVILLPNASGKTSIVRGLSAILSLPCVSILSKEEAKMHGLLSEEGKMHPLVNIYSSKGLAKISMKIIYNGKIEKRMCEISKDGKVKVRPKGDDIFLFTGLLTKESKIVRQLISGNNDFRWLVDELSYASRYEQVKYILIKLIDSFSIQKSLFEEKNKQLTNELSEIKYVENELEEVNKTLDQINLEIDQKLKEKTDIPQNLQELRDNLIEERKRIEKELNEYNKMLKIAIEKKRKFDEMRIEIDELRKKVENKEREKNKLNESIKNLENELKIFREKRPAMISELNEKIQRINEKIENLREQRGKYIGQLNLIESGLEIVKRESKSICPLCESTNIDIKILSDKQNRLNMLISEVNNTLDSLIKERTQILNELDALNKKEQEMQNKITQYKNDLKVLNNELDELRKKYQIAVVNFNSKEREAAEETIINLERNINELKNQMKKIEEEYNSILEKIKKFEEKRGITDIELGKLQERKTLLEKRKRELEHKLNEKNKFIEKLRFVTISEQRVLPMDKALKIYETWINILETVIRNIEQKIIEQREGLRKRFNSEVTKLMKSLDFSDFERILLDERYHLRVYRSKNVEQPVSSLSASERAIIATLLQISAKEAYLSDIPIFIMDELILDFDRIRFRGIISYFSDLLRNRNEIVLLTLHTKHEYIEELEREGLLNIVTL